MRKLNEIIKSELLSSETEKQYILEHSGDITLAEYILMYLKSKPGFVRKLEEGPGKTDLELSEAYYLELINQKVSGGKPIELFLTSYNPKSQLNEVSNGQIYPDMAELLSFVHLSMISKHIRDVYNPGFRFIIAYEGNFFREASTLTKVETNRVYEILQMLIKEAERITGTRNAIHLCDLEEIVQNLGVEFHAELENEVLKVTQEVEDGEYDATEAIISFLNFVVPVDKFESREAAFDYLKKYVIDIEAFGRLSDGDGNGKLGVRKAYPNSINATAKMFRSKGKQDAIRFHLFPNEVTYPYNRIGMLGKDGSWKLVRWENIANNLSYVPVYVDELPYPFYYKEN